MLYDIGKESTNFKYVPQREKIRTDEVGENEKLEGQSQRGRGPFLPTLPSTTQTTVILTLL